jgi:hypothetical protein
MGQMTVSHSAPAAIFPDLQYNHHPRELPSLIPMPISGPLLASSLIFIQLSPHADLPPAENTIDRHDI